MNIELPYEFLPRFYQLPLIKAIDGGCKRAVAVWHRRAGKEKVCFNIMIKQAMRRTGLYFYCFPEYNQGRKILWKGRDKEGKFQSAKKRVWGDYKHDVSQSFKFYIVSIR